MNQESSSTPIPPEPLDPTRLDKLRALQEATGRDFLREVIELYLADAPERLESLRKALSEGDAARAEQLAHSLKGSSSNIGALLVETAAAELERCLVQGRLDGAGEGLAQLESEIDRACRALRDLGS